MSLFGGNTPKRTRLRLLDIFPKGTLGAGNEPTTVGAGVDIPLVIASPSVQGVDLIQAQTAAAAPVGIFRVDSQGNVYGNSVSNITLQSVAQVPLTAAQIIAMYTTPVSILPTLTQTVTAATWVSGVATYTVGSTANLQVGYTVTVASVTPSGYNVTAVVTAILSATKFQVAITSTVGTYSSGGTVKVGGGQIYLMDFAILQTKPTATQFTSGGTVSFQYHGLSTSPFAAVIATAANIQSATAVVNLIGPVTQAVILEQANIGLGLDITNATGVFATGTGTAVVTVGYSILTLS